jgi:hypothetical protein
VGNGGAVKDEFDELGDLEEEEKAPVKKISA